MKSDSISNFVNNAMDRFIDSGTGCRDFHFNCLPQVLLGWRSSASLTDRLFVDWQGGAMMLSLQPCCLNKATGSSD